MLTDNIDKETQAAIDKINLEDLKKQKIGAQVSFKKIETLRRSHKILLDKYAANMCKDLVKVAAEMGYTETWAFKVLSKPIAQRYLDRKINIMTKKLDITAEKKMSLLWRAAKRCYGIKDADLKNGVEEGLFKFNATGLVAAVSELNKMQGHYAAVKTVNANVNSEDSEKLTELIKTFEKEY